MNIRHFITASLLGMAVSLPAMAQTEAEGQPAKAKKAVETNGFKYNWFISVGAGGQIYYGDHDKQGDFGDRIAPALDVAVGKWFIPQLGMRLMYSGLKAKGATQDGIHGTGSELPGKGGAPWWLEKQEFNLAHIHADVLFNLNSIIAGYKADRLWNCNLYGGLGLVRVTESPKENALAGNLGVMNSFRLSDAIDLNLDVRGMLGNDDLDGEKGGKSGEGMLSASIGISYKFKPRGWSHSREVVRYDHSAMDAMQQKLDANAAEIAALKQKLAEGKKAEVQTIVKRIAASNLVTFPIGKSKLTKEARVNLNLLAQVIKSADPEAVYTITGYADAGTGSKELNEKLSKERADAVYNCLIKEFKVPAKQLRLDYKGGVDNMYYDDPRLSRAVITYVEE